MASQHGDRRSDFDRRKEDRRKNNRRKPAESRRDWASPDLFKGRPYDYESEKKAGGRREHKDKRSGLDRRQSQNRVDVRRKAQRRAGDRRKNYRRVEDRLVESRKLRNFIQPQDTVKARISEPKPVNSKQQIYQGVIEQIVPKSDSLIGKKAEGDTFKPVGERVGDWTHRFAVNVSSYFRKFRRGE